MTSLVAVESLGDPVAYMWLSPVAGSQEGALAELHLCAKPTHTSKWLTPGVLRSGYKWLRSSGAKYILALHKNNAYRDLLVRLGFVAHGDFVHILNLESSHGLLKCNFWRGRGRGTGS